jgi:hypothetical protein
MKTDEIKLLIDAKLKEKRDAISDFDAQISALENDLLVATQKENGFEIGEKVAGVCYGKKEIGFFGGYRIKHGYVEPVVYKIKNDGTASKNELYMYGKKIEKI